MFFCGVERIHLTLQPPHRPHKGEKFSWKVLLTRQVPDLVTGLARCSKTTSISSLPSTTCLAWSKMNCHRTTIFRRSETNTSASSLRQVKWLVTLWGAREEASRRRHFRESIYPGTSGTIFCMNVVVDIADYRSDVLPRPCRTRVDPVPPGPSKSVRRMSLNLMRVIDSVMLVKMLYIIHSYSTMTYHALDRGCCSCSGVSWTQTTCIGL